MERKYSFIKYLSENTEKMITVDASDRNAAKREIDQSSRKNNGQLKAQERADANQTRADADAEQNPQLKTLKMQKAIAMTRLAEINDKIARISGK